MAREIIIRIRDDLDPEKLADKTVDFAYNGTNYEIDLTAQHCEEFDEAMGRFVQAARVVVPEPQTRGKRGRKQPQAGSPWVTEERRPAFEQRSRIRAWANETGFRVHSSGMLARHIIKAYSETHPDDPLLAETWPAYPKGQKRKRQSVVSVTAANGNDQTALELLQAEIGPGEERSYTYKGHNGKSYTQVRNTVLEKQMRPFRDKVRAWGNANGIRVATKSVVPERVMMAYKETHPDEFDERGLPRLDKI